MDEHQHQARLIAWRDENIETYPELKWLIAIMNDIPGLHSSTASRIQREGLRPGVSDLFLALPAGGYHGLWLELKTPHWGELRPEQTEWLEEMAELGYAVSVAYGWEQGRDALIQYLQGSHWWPADVPR